MASRVENFSESRTGISFGKTTENQVEGICTYALWLQLTLSVYLWLIASVHLCVVASHKIHCRLVAWHGNYNILCITA